MCVESKCKPLVYSVVQVQYIFFVWFVYGGDNKQIFTLFCGN